jgi:4'-phosphopantetheinyl transferase
LSSGGSEGSVVLSTVEARGVICDYYLGERLAQRPSKILSTAGVEKRRLKEQMRQPCKATEVSIRCSLTDHLDDESVIREIAVLSAEERARLDRFEFRRERRDIGVAHALLRRSLSCRFGGDPRTWTFAADEFGKPRLASNRTELKLISFNLAHTRGAAACAIASAAEVGVDVETIDPSFDVLRFAQRYFSPEEIFALERCSDEARPVRFFELWVLKEAVLKATGLGLHGRLADVSFNLDESIGIQFAASHGIDRSSWQFAVYAPSPRHRVAVALRRADAASHTFKATVSMDGRIERDLFPARTGVVTTAL